MKTKDLKSKWLRNKIKKIKSKEKSNNKEKSSRNSMNNHSRIKSTKRITWRNNKLKKTKSSSRHGNPNSLNLMEWKKRRRSLENKSSGKTNWIWKSKWSKNKARDKPKLESNLKRPKGQRRISKTKINNLNRMHKSA